MREEKATIHRTLVEINGSSAASIKKLWLGNTDVSYIELDQASWGFIEGSAYKQKFALTDYVTFLRKSLAVRPDNLVK